MGGKTEKWLRRWKDILSDVALEPWTPFERSTLPGVPEAEVYLNSRYQVLITRFDIDAPFGECVHLSIKLRDKKAWHDWRDMQRIKNELVGPEVEAVEMFPAESRLMDTANQYHLWCFPKFKFPFGYKTREVSEAMPQDPMGGRPVQRPFDVKPPDLASEEEQLKKSHQDYADLYFGRRKLTDRYGR